MFRISIHALVKRATGNYTGISVGGDISIHALVKRATSIYSLASSSLLFQSTPS